jgi:hypothetical protein
MGDVSTLREVAKLIEGNPKVGMPIRTLLYFDFLGSSLRERIKPLSGKGGQYSARPIY